MKPFIGKPIDNASVRTGSLADRTSKVALADFAKPPSGDTSFQSFWRSLPDILGAKDLRELASRMVKARNAEKLLHWSIGAHVIKVGLAPVLIDLMDRGYLRALSVNGAVLVHDSEIALAGKTSEDVDATLDDGTFGVTEETAAFLNQAAIAAADANQGLAQTIGERLLAAKAAHLEQSVLAQAVLRKIPVTAHVALGTDVVHLHPNADGAAIGKATLHDFRVFADLTSRLEDGVYLNVGSAVLMPEIFLKAITLVRNLGYQVESFTTANFDFIRHYRPIANVVTRPTGKSGKGFHFTGQHELLLPLLAHGILATESWVEG